MQRQNALSLIELIVVIAILGVLAVAVIPAMVSTDPVKLDRASDEVAAALRFARSESIRTGEVHGVLVDHDGTESVGQDLVVYKVDLNASPFAVEQALFHPIRKIPYDLSINDDPALRGVFIANAVEAFTFDGVGAGKHVHFDATGRPVCYKDKRPHRLLSGGVRLGNAREQRMVTVQPETGRIIIR